MSLDDRMRQAYGRQLDDVRHRVGEIDAVPSFEPVVGRRPGPAARVLALAAAVVVVGAGVAMMVRLADDRATPVVTDPAGEGQTSAPPAPDDATGEGAGGGSQDSGSDDGGPLIRVETTVADDDEGPEVSTSQDGAGTDDTVAAAGDAGRGLASGVANDVCPTGLRAELERATIDYVGPAEGWGRKDDLVDEQDGPFYFRAWEPGFPDPVEVEIVLDRPVLANEVRVAQDPYTAVGGAITVTIDGRSTPIELDGVGGWKVLDLAEPAIIARIGVRRDQADSNIVELLVCVEPSSGP